MKRIKPLLDAAVNLAILVVAVCFVILTYRSFHGIEKNRLPLTSSIKQGDTLPFSPELKGHSSLVFFLQTGCSFCRHSVPFYQHLALLAKSKNVSVVFVFPERTEEAQKFLLTNSLPTNHVLRQTFESMGIRGTPTLILVNKDGKVRSVWVGELPSEEERKVENSLD